MTSAPPARLEKIRALLETREQHCAHLTTLVDNQQYAAIPKFIKTLHTQTVRLQQLAAKLPGNEYTKKQATNSEVYNLTKIVVSSENSDCFRIFGESLQTVKDISDFLSHALFQAFLRKPHLIEQVLATTQHLLRTHPLLCAAQSAKEFVFLSVCVECLDKDSIRQFQQLAEAFPAEFQQQLQYLHLRALSAHATDSIEFITRRSVDVANFDAKNCCRYLEELLTASRKPAGDAFAGILRHILRLVPFSSTALVTLAYRHLAPAGAGLAFFTALQKARQQQPNLKLPQLVSTALQLPLTALPSLNRQAFDSLSHQKQFQALRMLLEAPRKFPLQRSEESDKRLLKLAITESPDFFDWFLTTRTAAKKTSLRFQDFFVELFQSRQQRLLDRLIEEVNMRSLTTPLEDIWTAYCASFESSTAVANARCIVQHFRENLRQAFSQQLEKTVPRKKTRNSSRHWQTDTPFQDLEGSLARFFERNRNTGLLPDFLSFLQTDLPEEQLAVFSRMLFRISQMYSNTTQELTTLFLGTFDTEDDLRRVLYAFDDLPVEAMAAQFPIGSSERCLLDHVEQRLQIIARLRQTSIPTSDWSLFAATISETAYVNRQLQFQAKWPVEVRLLLDAQLSSLTEIRLGSQLCATAGITYADYPSSAKVQQLLRVVQSQSTIVNKTRRRI